MKFCGSLYCTPVTYIILYINNTSIKKRSVILWFYFFFFFFKWKQVYWEIHIPKAECCPSQKARAAPGHEVVLESESSLWFYFSPNTWDTILGFKELLCGGRGRSVHKAGAVKEGKRQREPRERLLWSWDLRSMRPLQDTSRSSCWAVHGVKGSAVRWSQVSILTQLLTNCKAGAGFCFLLLFLTSLRLSFFSWMKIVYFPQYSCGEN